MHVCCVRTAKLVLSLSTDISIGENIFAFKKKL